MFRRGPTMMGCMSTAGPQQTHEVHGHEVMNLLLTAGRPLSRDELVAAIVERFGSAARFYTCSARGLTAAGIVAFLDERSKLTEVGGGLTTSPDRICSHDEQH